MMEMMIIEKKNYGKDIPSIVEVVFVSVVKMCVSALKT